MRWREVVLTHRGGLERAQSQETRLTDLTDLYTGVTGETRLGHSHQGKENIQLAVKETLLLLLLGLTVRRGGLSSHLLRQPSHDSLHLQPGAHHGVPALEVGGRLLVVC